MIPETLAGDAPANMQTSAEWIFEPGRVANLLSGLHFLPELIDHLERLVTRLGNSPERGAFVQAALTWLSGDCSKSKALSSDIQAAIAIAGLPLMCARHRERGLPYSITAATARDMQRRMLEAREESGLWEFSRLYWFENHVHRDLLEIGRLQYQLAPFGAPCRIYIEKKNNGVHAFAECGLPCSDAGWIEKAGGFTTSFQVDEAAIVGNPVDFATGQIRSRPVHIADGDLQLILSRSMPACHIHVPSGAGLDSSTCKDSLERAAALFEKHFPEVPWRAFCCTSWLLDRELWKCLPADSNIVAFARMFLPLASPHATDRQLIDRVFAGRDDWRSLVPRTRLQQNVQAHLAGGGSFRETGGVILRSAMTSE